MIIQSSEPVRYIMQDNLSPWRNLLLASTPPPIEIEAGGLISKSGIPSSYVYFLLDGLVRVYTTNANGYVRLLGYHMANSLFVLDDLRGGEVSLVTTEAMTKIHVLAITQPQLHTLCLNHPPFATDLMLYVGDVLRLMCYESEKLAVLDVKTRLVNFMCLYLESVPADKPRCIPMTQESLASAISASRVQTARACAQLKASGLILTGRKTIQVIDESALQPFRQ